MPSNKNYQVKVYESDGITLVSTINPNEIQNEISFKAQINSGLGELVLEVKRPFDNFGEGTDINILNIVKVYEFDSDNTTPRLIYTGFISQYNPFTTQDDEGVKITCLGILSMLTFILYRVGGAIDFNKNASPETIIGEIVSNFSLNYAGLVTTSLSATGATSNIDFSKQDSKAALDTVFKTIGGNFYYYLGADGVLTLATIPSSATHTFTVGKHIDTIDAQKSSEDVINSVTVYYTGGSVTATDAASIALNGKREKVFTNTEIANNATATAYANQKIIESKDRKIKAVMRINSSYDIETIHPGDTCKIQNIRAEQLTFSNNMKIVSVSYASDYVTIELDDFRTNFGSELQNFIS